MLTSVWLLTAAVALTGPDGRIDGSRSRRPERRITGCNVELIDNVQVAAQESGLLTAINVREGAYVEEGELLAQINDSKAVMAKRVAEAEHKVALAEAESDISVRYSQKASEVAKKDFQAHREANLKVPGSTPLTEMEKLRLTWEKGVLEIEKAELELKVAKLTAEAKLAAVDAAEDDIHRRKVLAPTSGAVVEVFKHVGEWVNPGDRVLRLVRMDKLWVVASELKIEEVAPESIMNRPVIVEAKLTGGRIEEFKGQVVFVDPIVIEGGKFRIKVEVVNRQENGVWLLLSGMEADVIVDTGIAASRPKKPATR